MNNSYTLYSSLHFGELPKVYAEIDMSVLAANFNRLKKNLPDSVTPICVVKADAYGHGAPQCAKVLEKEGCGFLAVSSIEEATAIRASGYSGNILILGYTSPALAAELAQHNIIQSILSYDYATRLSDSASSAGVNVRIHIAVDTGMNRIGVSATRYGDISDACDTVESICKLDGLVPEGIFSHFYAADSPVNTGSTYTQFEIFSGICQEMKRRGFDLFRHICNSAATLKRSDCFLDGVRIGIALYGIDPAPHIETNTEPVMRLKTVISHIHTVRKGDTVGYGATFVAPRDVEIATLPIGYADGFMRSYKGCCVTVHTEVGDFRAEIVGNICMDQCMIDVSGIPVKTGNVVTVFGDRKDALSMLANAAKTIEYEALCLVSARVPRFYLK